MSEKEEIKYDNTKLCRRNFKFIDHLIDKGFDFLLLGFIALLILGVWFDFPLIVNRLMISDVILLVFTLIFYRTKYIEANNEQLEYYDEYSRVVETPKNPDSESLEG